MFCQTIIQFKNKEKKLLGAYFHIPFCKKKCSYCNFYSTVYTEELEEKFLNAVLKEQESYLKNSKKLNTIYFGGGSPCLVKATTLQKILKKAEQIFKIKKNAEITIEINPSSAVKEKLLEYKLIGINRLSFGVQSFNDFELKKLGRTHDGKTALKAIKTAQEVGFKNISIDLIIGIPEQTQSSLKENLQIVKSLNISHVSIYQLKIEPKTKFFNNPPKNLPEDDLVAKFYFLVFNELLNGGFLQYEISNFSKKFKQSKHNLKYWTLKEYLGFGPSAHSFYLNKRFYNEPNLKEYLKNPQKTIKEEVNLKLEWFILSFRLNKGILIFSLKQKGFYTKVFKQKLKKLEQEKLIYFKNFRIMLTLKGKMLLNSVLTYLLN